MSADVGTLLVIAKQPVPGRVKTRLVPPLTHDQAAALAGAALRDTLAAAETVRAAQRVLAFDGDHHAWLPTGWRHVRQPGGGLDARLGAAFDAADSGAPAVLVGMDTPQLRADHLAAVDLDRHDACLGLAVDGGFWTIGFTDPALARSVIAGVPMSTADTGAEQLRRMRAAGLDVQLLDVLTDVDTVADAQAVAEQAPHTHFAAAMAEIERAA